jgi:hypothetical protein
MVRRTRKNEMPKQMTEFEFVKSKIVEWEQNGKDVTIRLSQNSNQFYNWIMSNVNFKFKS